MDAGDPRPFGDDAEFEHLGFALPSINAVFPGLVAVADPLQKVRVAFTRLHGVPIELVEPLGEDSPIGQLLRKGQRLYHVCYRVDVIDEALRHAQQHGFHCIARPVPAVAFDLHRIAWVFSASLGLFELLEKARP